MSATMTSNAVPKAGSRNFWDLWSDAAKQAPAASKEDAKAAKKAAKKAKQQQHGAKNSGAPAPAAAAPAAPAKPLVEFPPKGAPVKVEVKGDPVKDGNADHAEAKTPAEHFTLLHTNRDACLKFLEDVNQNGWKNPATPDAPAVAVFQHPYKVFHHNPVYTCDEAERFAGIPEGTGAEMKNLFLRDKKKKLYMISALRDTEIKLKELELVPIDGETACKKGTIGFANHEKLLEVLGLIPGSVTPLGLTQEKERAAPQVSYYLDRNVMESEFEGAPYVVFHPNACNASIAIHREDFVRIIEGPAGHRVRLV